MRAVGILALLLAWLGAADAVRAQGGTGLTAACGTSNSNLATNAFVTGCAAPIAFYTLTSGHIFVGNSSNRPADVALTGDCTITNAGVISCPPVIATDAQTWAGTANKLEDAAHLNSAGQIVALTDAATIAVDMATGINFSVTLGGNRTLGAPSNTQAGRSGCIFVTQDGTGSRTLAYNSVWKFSNGLAPILTTAAASVDMLCYLVKDSTHIYATMNQDMR